jgi:hypothetical protein
MKLCNSIWKARGFPLYLRANAGKTVTAVSTVTFHIIVASAGIKTNDLMTAEDFQFSSIMSAMPNTTAKYTVY